MHVDMHQRGSSRPHVDVVARSNKHKLFLAYLGGAGLGLLFGWRLFRLWLGSVRLFRLHRGGRLGYLDFALVLRARCALAVLAGLAVSRVVVLVDLRVKILVLILVLEHLSLVVASRDFGAIAEEDDAAAVIAVRPEAAVEIHVDVIRRIVNAMVNTGTAELSYTIALETELLARLG